MSGFTAAAISTLDYDFTGIPNANGEGNCTGKGIVTEPSDDRIKAFGDGRKVLAEQAKAAAEGNGEPPTPADARALAAGLCGGSPTRAEIDELPPRAFTAFGSWLLGELAPKG